jgi:hypothetical protein
MQIISDETFEALAKKKNGKKHPVSVAIAALEVGQNLQITPADWKWKTKTPSILVLREAKKTRKRFEFYKQTAELGWLVKRIK